MSENLKKTFPLLWLLSNTKEPERKRLLGELATRKSVYNAVAEIANNKLKGHFDKNIKSLDKRQLKKLNRHDKVFGQLCCKQKCKKVRKNLVKQTGGILPILIPLLTGILGSELKNIF
jgi:hypothetical protein